MVYLTPGCPYCMMARRLLGARGIPFESYDVSGNSAARAWLRTATNQTTVPQIFIKGRSVGGFDELSQLDSSGELQTWLTR
ncbi:Glutaredoxin-3 [Enhygromyxa salina]|uniref:Glutaredoxin-3 n=1 Tax=Enhygromyxa salina TaxID=215803 RepID=A0A2S9YUN8_9BACT|nr:Glutaredoxin-3 [Enhygromyxa salina]